MTADTWAELDVNARASGISNKWIGNDHQPDVWNLSGFMEGAQGAFISGPVKGLVHVPFKRIEHAPAYGPPRFERTVDERREISTRICLYGDTEFSYQGVETRFWDGMNGDDPGYWTAFTRRLGEMWIPMQLADTISTELEYDPQFDCYSQEWDVLLAADGEPRWRMPDVRPPDWVNTMSTGGATTTVKRDEALLAPNITVGVGTFKVANKGTTKSWPIYTVEAATTGVSRVWLPDGVSGRMLRVPPLNPGEHIIVDTNPEYRIAISATEPVDTQGKRHIRNAELLKWLFGQFGESGTTVLERFHGQGFTQPVDPGTVAVLPVYHNRNRCRISVRLPQRFERAIS